MAVSLLCDVTDTRVSKRSGWVMRWIKSRQFECTFNIFHQKPSIVAPLTPFGACFVAYWVPLSSWSLSLVSHTTSLPKKRMNPRKMKPYMRRYWTPWTPLTIPSKKPYLILTDLLLGWFTSFNCLNDWYFKLSKHLTSL